MTDGTEQVSTTGLVDTKQQPDPTKRRQYSEALKRQIVAETLEPGSSVSIVAETLEPGSSIVARRHDVNSNQLAHYAVHQTVDMLNRARRKSGTHRFGLLQLPIKLGEVNGLEFLDPGPAEMRITAVTSTRSSVRYGKRSGLPSTMQGCGR